MGSVKSCETRRRRKSLRSVAAGGRCGTWATLTRRALLIGRAATGVLPGSVICCLFSRVRLGACSRREASVDSSRAAREAEARGARGLSGRLRQGSLGALRLPAHSPVREPQATGIKNGMPARASRFGGGRVGMRSLKSVCADSSTADASEAGTKIGASSSCDVAARSAAGSPFVGSDSPGKRERLKRRGMLLTIFVG